MFVGPAEGGMGGKQPAMAAPVTAVAAAPAAPKAVVNK